MDDHFWLDRVPIRKQLACFWHFSRNRSVDETVEEVDLSRASVYSLCRFFVNVASEHQGLMNDQLEIGGAFVQCETDEVAFRCKVSTRADGSACIVWLRYIAIVRRGSVHIFLAPLPDRSVSGAGQGGGGSLAIDELVSVLRVLTDRPVLRWRSILHTDSAKAYRKVGPMR